jgi:hypothetical protein
MLRRNAARLIVLVALVVGLLVTLQGRLDPAHASAPASAFGADGWSWDE